MKTENTKAQMRKGVLEYCILLVLKEKTQYPVNILQVLKESKLIIVEGTLYPLLTRLKNDGLLYLKPGQPPSASKCVENRLRSGTSKNG